MEGLLNIAFYYVLIPLIVLGIAVMSLFVVAINRAFWRPLYRYAERKYRLE